MSFTFPDTNSSPLSFEKLLTSNKGVRSVPEEYLHALSHSRQKMCNALSSQPSTQAALDAIEEYLPFIDQLIEIGEKSTERRIFWERCDKIRWRSVLAKGIRMSLSGSSIEKPMIGVKSVYFDATYGLLAYGFTLANIASKRVGSNATSASEVTYNDAADMLARAAGVFRFIAVGILPRWRNKPEEAPPECSVEVVTVLSDLMLADANRLALLKAEKKGMSSATLVKLGASVLALYEGCSVTLKRVCKHDAEELADAFSSYVHDGYAMVEATLLRRYAEIKHGEDQNGLAVAAITQTYNQLVSLKNSTWTPYRSVAASMLPEVEDMRTRYVRINNNVTYQKVPSIQELKGTLPTCKAIIDARPFDIKDLYQQQQQH